MTNQEWIRHLQLHIQIAKRDGFNAFALALEALLKEAVDAETTDYVPLFHI